MTRFESGRLTRLFWRFVSFGLILLLWLFGSAFSSNYLIPSPWEVLIVLFSLVGGRDVWLHLGASVVLVSSGFLVSLVVAFPTAALWSRFRIGEGILRPVHEFVRYIPVPAFVPLCAVWFGVGQGTKIALIFIGTYFQLVFLFFEDFSRVPREYSEIGLCLGLRRFRLFRKVHVPAAFPALLDSSRIAFAWAWSYLLVAEVVNSRVGIGFFVLQSYRRLDMPKMVALLIVIGCFGYVADVALRRVKDAICPWIKPANN